MKTLSDLEELKTLQQESEALLILFGGAQCNVCQVIKPKIEALIETQFPNMESVYVDCPATPDLCAQYGVLSLPTVQVYFTGQRFIELVRTFSLGQLQQQIERPYRLLFTSDTHHKTV